MAQMGTKSLVKSNIELWMNDLFLRNGLYTNVASGETNIYGYDISRLMPSQDPTFTQNNTVFQSPFKNWVYESGIIPIESGINPPIVASGVIVDGIFYQTTTTTGTYSHIIDFPNGRVIFDNSLTGSPVVQAAYSFKEITVDFANRFNNENMSLQIETSMKDNPSQTGVDTYPKSDTRTLPAVFIDFISRSSFGYELGWRSLVADFVGIFHVWTRDDYYRDLIEDILASEQRQIVLGINFNNAEYPILSKGERNNNFTTYSSLASINNSNFWRRIYIDSISVSKDSSLFEIERSRINFTARVYPNF